MHYSSFVSLSSCIFRRIYHIYNFIQNWGENFSNTLIVKQQLTCQCYNFYVCFTLLWQGLAVLRHGNFSQIHHTYDLYIRVQFLHKIKVKISVTERSSSHSLSDNATFNLHAYVTQTSADFSCSTSWEFLANPPYTIQATVEGLLESVLK